MKRGVQPVAAAVAGEHPTVRLRAVRGWGQPDDQDCRLWITKSRHRATPVGVVGKGATLFARRPVHATATSRGHARQSQIDRIELWHAGEMPSAAACTSSAVRDVTSTREPVMQERRGALPRLAEAAAS